MTWQVMIAWKGLRWYDAHADTQTNNASAAHNTFCTTHSDLKHMAILDTHCPEVFSGA
jgi:hypothetical protein